MKNNNPTVYVFDLDGVITNPEDSEVDEAVVEVIRKIMMGSDLVAVNTGRSYQWVKDNLVDRLEPEDSKGMFHRFVIACEKGGELVSWDGGTWSITPSEFGLGPEAYAATKKCFEENRATAATMFWDITKRTMATIEKKPSADLALFHDEQHRLVEKLSDSLSGFKVRIDATTIATDVESLSAGKYSGASLIHKWVNERHPSFTSYVSIGDSVSDYEMARYFAEQSMGSTFVYVGKPTEEIDQSPLIAMISTEKLYTSGALEYFRAE